MPQVKSHLERALTHFRDGYYYLADNEVWQAIAAFETTPREEQLVMVAIRLQIAARLMGDVLRQYGPYRADVAAVVG